MRKAMVITIPKKNRKKTLLKNERQIFLVNNVKSILMKLIFNMKYNTLNSNMSNINVGGWKNNRDINHIWVMQSIIHENLSRSKSVPIVIQQFDYRQMIDSMDKEEACDDIYDYGIDDDHLTLIHDANKKDIICVKTNYGMSKEYQLTNQIMEGDTWACAKASAQVDSFGKKMLTQGPNFYVKIPHTGDIKSLDRCG